jgi:hypothetical protein
MRTLSTGMSGTLSRRRRIEYRTSHERRARPVAWLRDRLYSGEALAGVRVIFTFCPFARLPAGVREAYLARRLLLVPSPASLVFGEHPLYRKLAGELPHAMEIPLLHLFHRVQGGYAIRIPQSGWIEEHDAAEHAHGHRVVSRVVEPTSGDSTAPRVTLAPRLLDRPGHREAATLFTHDLDYCAALTAIAIETVATVACATTV